MRKSTLLLLCIVLVCGSILRFYGLAWGVPRQPYWRYHYQDEGFTLGLILQMKPTELNPHYFINPTFHYYTLLLSLKAASLAGYIEPFSMPVELEGLGRPREGVSISDYARMYFVGRIVSVIQSILLILLVFLIGRNLYDDLTGLIAAACTAVLPTLAFQSHLLVVNAPAVFWLMLAFYFLTTRVSQKRKILWYVVAGALMGIAIGTKYTNVLIIFAFLYKMYLVNRAAKRTFFSTLVNRHTLTTCAAAFAIFILTSPYIVFSFNEFLYGDSSGFGGILGERGLLSYNRFGLNLITPFTFSTFCSLRLPLTLVAIGSLCYTVYRRSEADKLLLAYIVPFYVLLIVNASPHLRHALPVLPFLMLVTGRFLTDIITYKKHKAVKLTGIGLLFISTVYTLFFTLSFVRRMDAYDTRIQCADWIRTRVSDETRVGVATFYPWNYTPPIETFMPRPTIIEFNYENLLHKKPDLFLITEYEYRDFINTHESEVTSREFVKKLFSEEHYTVLKKFKKEFSIFGITFVPYFPNTNWNPVNPTIYVFRTKF